MPPSVPLCLCGYVHCAKAWHCSTSQEHQALTPWPVRAHEEVFDAGVDVFEVVAEVLQVEVEVGQPGTWGVVVCRESALLVVAGAVAALVDRRAPAYAETRVRRRAPAR